MRFIVLSLALLALFAVSQVKRPVPDSRELESPSKPSHEVPAEVGRPLNRNLLT